MGHQEQPVRTLSTSSQPTHTPSTPTQAARTPSTHVELRITLRSSLGQGRPLPLVIDSLVQKGRVRAWPPAPACNETLTTLGFSLATRAPPPDTPTNPNPTNHTNRTTTPTYHAYDRPIIMCCILYAMLAMDGSYNRRTEDRMLTCDPTMYLSNRVID